MLLACILAVLVDVRAGAFNGFARRGLELRRPQSSLEPWVDKTDDMERGRDVRQRRNRCPRGDRIRTRRTARMRREERIAGGRQVSECAAYHFLQVGRAKERVVDLDGLSASDLRHGGCVGGSGSGVGRYGAAARAGDLSRRGRGVGVV